MMTREEVIEKLNEKSENVKARIDPEVFKEAARMLSEAPQSPEKPHVCTCHKNSTEYLKEKLNDAFDEVMNAPGVMVSLGGKLMIEDATRKFLQSVDGR